MKAEDFSETFAHVVCYATSRSRSNLSVGNESTRRMLIKETEKKAIGVIGTDLQAEEN
jgi:hypothetical protein